MRPNKRGKTPLYIASHFGNTDTARLLIDSKAEIDKANKRGDTPLSIAVYRRNTDTAKLLIENGASIDKANKRGDTPLIFASLTSNMPVVELLVEYGADITIRGSENMTALDIANRMHMTSYYDEINQNNEAIIKFLKDHQRKHQIKKTLRPNLISGLMPVIYEYAGLKN